MPGKGTDIGFSLIEDEHSIVDVGSTSSRIETGDSHFMDKAQVVALEESEDQLTKVLLCDHLLSLTSMISFMCT